MILYRPLLRGSMKNSIYVEMQDAATPFLPKAGFTFDEADIILSYCKKRGARVAISPVTLAAATTAWTSGGVKLVDDTNQIGLVRFDIPDAAFADDGVSDEVVVTIQATGFRTRHVSIPLTDKQDVWVSPGTTRANS
jgi:hypothetical protein